VPVLLSEGYEQVINPEARDSDADLERAIDFQHGLLVTALTPAEQTAAWDEMKRLIEQRSPEQVEAMERERGLR
jgi:hypothetical protein